MAEVIGRRLLALFAIGVVAAAGSACSSESHADDSFEPELRAVVAQAGLDINVDGSVVHETGIRAQCNDPAFDREAPAIWFTIPAPGGTHRAVLANIADRVSAQSWSVEVSDVRTMFSGDTARGGFHGDATSQPDAVELTVYLDDDWTC